MTTSVLIRPNGVSAHEEAYHYLFEAIRSGRLTGGAHVKTEEVAAKLGLSRMPVREAVRQLATEGFLTLRPNRGAIVTVFSRDEIMELFEMRAALEGFAMREVVVKIDAEGLRDGGAALDRLDRARGDLDRWIQAHDHFHDVLNRYCSRRRLITEVRRWRTNVEPYLRVCMRRDPTAITDTTREHAELLDVIAKGDPDTAERTTRAHITAINVVDYMP